MSDMPAAVPSPTDLHIRPARPEDKEPVLAFTQDTWTWGDYIDWVWERWLTDPAGSLIVGEVDGRVMGLDMLSVPRPGEGWFQGLRIDPAYRGHGYARRFEEYQLAEARRRGLHTVRFLTAESNVAVHKTAARHGFQRRAGFLYHRAERDNPATQAALRTLSAIPLAPLAADAAAATWATVQQSALWQASAGCLGADWVFAGFTPAWWTELLARACVWTSAAGGLIILAPLRPHLPADDDCWLAWLDPGPNASPDAVAALAAAASHHAWEQGHSRIETLWPRLPVWEEGLRRAGWQPDPDEDETMLLFGVTL
jgi:GNAT superfamily N-acetyltransferase